MRLSRISVLGGLLAVGALSAVVAGQQPAPARRAAGPGEGQGQPLRHHGVEPAPRSRLHRRQRRRVRHRHRRRRRRHEARRLGPDIIARDQDRDRQAVTTIINTHTHGDHTGSNDGFPATRRHRRAREHEGEHGEDGRLQGRQGAVPAEADLQGQADARQRQGSHRPVLLRRRPHERRHVRRLSRRCGCCRPATCSRGRTRRSIDRSNGGSGVEHPKTMAKLLATVKNVDTVIPGHSPVTTLEGPAGVSAVHGRSAGGDARRR